MYGKFFNSYVSVTGGFSNIGINLLQNNQPYETSDVTSVKVRGFWTTWWMVQPPEKASVTFTTN